MLSSSEDERDIMTPSPPSKTKVILEDPFVDPPKPAKQNVVQPDPEPNPQADSRRRSLRPRNSLGRMRPPPNNSGGQDQPQPQRQVQKETFSGHGHPQAESPFVLKLKQAAKASSEDLYGDGYSGEQTQAAQQTSNSKSQPTGDMQPMRLIPNSNTRTDSQSFPVPAQPKPVPEPFQPSASSKNKVNTIQPSSQAKDSAEPAPTKPVTKKQAAPPENTCKPMQITHQTCTHIILIHSRTCIPTGSICGYQANSWTIHPGICPRCVKLPVTEIENLIRHKVERAVESAKRKEAYGHLARAIDEIDDTAAEVMRLRAVREWILTGGRGWEERRGREIPRGVDRDVGSVREGGGTWAESGESVDRNLGQQVVDSIECLKVMMGEWIQAGGDEDEVRGRIRDVLGVGGGHIENGA